MALTQQGGGGFLTPGGQSLQEKYGIGPMSPGGVPVGGFGSGQRVDPFDRWDNYFQRTTTFKPGRPGSDELSGAYIARNKRAIEESKTLTGDKQRLLALAKRIGVDVSDPGALGILWMDAVDEARAASAVDPGIVNVNRGPWEILERWARTGSYEGKAGGKKSQAGTFSQTQKQINLTDPQTARAVIMDALRARLDRDPTDAEVKAFTSALRGTEEENPATSTTTSTYDTEGRLVSSDSRTEGGAPSPSAFAENFLTDEHDAEADAVRAGQEYFDAARQLAQGLV